MTTRRNDGQERMVPDQQAREGVPLGTVHMPVSRRAREHRRKRARGSVWWLYAIPIAIGTVGGFLMSQIISMIAGGV